MTAIAACCSGAIAGRSVRAAPSKKRVGILNVGRDSNPKPRPERPFWVEMRKRGWVIGENLDVLPAFANDDRTALPGLAAELVRQRVDLIDTDGESATLAAARATSTIPILFGEILYPLEQGLIRSYARPGGNLTGLAYYAGLEMSTKALEYLRALAPNAKRLAWLSVKENHFRTENLRGEVVDLTPARVEAARRFGFEDSSFHFLAPTGDREKSRALFDELSSRGVQSLFVSGWTIEPPTLGPELALRHRLPSAWSHTWDVEAGGLCSFTFPTEYWSDWTRRTAADYMDRILRGANPAELPVQRPDRYEFALNLKTARALGLQVPGWLLQRAEVLIQ